MLSGDSSCFMFKVRAYEKSSSYFQFINYLSLMCMQSPLSVKCILQKMFFCHFYKGKQLSGLPV